MKVQLFEVFTTVEEEFDVNSIQYKGISIWPLIRISLLARGERFERNPKKGFRFELKKLWLILKAKFLDRNNNLKLTGDHFDYGLFFDVLDRRIPIGDSYFSRISEAIQYFIGTQKKALALEYTRINEIPVKRYFPSYFIYSKLFWLLVAQKINRLLPGKDHQEEILNLDKLLNFLKEKQIQHNIRADKLKIQIEKILAYQKLFYRLLQTKKISYFFILAYYNNVKMGLILACRQLGIPTIDIQHGLQGPHHIAYGSWQNAPQKGYDLLPDTFWVWDNLAKENIEKWAQATPHKAILGGNPWIAFYQKHKEQINPPLPNIKDSRFHIFITVSIMDHFYQSWIIDFIRMHQKSYLFSIRVHPAMLHELPAFETFLKEKGIFDYDVKWSNTLPLFPLLQNCDIHLTFTSTTALEALYFQKPSAVIHERGNLFFQTEIEKGWLQYISQTEELTKTIEQIQKGQITVSEEFGRSEEEKVNTCLQKLFPDRSTKDR